MTAVLDRALSYAAAGLPVFPVGADKKPLHKGGFHAATCDPGTITEWYRDHPRAGIAAPMGPPSRVWALDLDVERINPDTGEVTPSGEDTLAALVDRYGPLPSTLSQRTGGGRQLLWRWTGERIRNRAGDLGPGLDTRGVKPDGTAGGYIVLPPSPHISGERYAWTNPAGEAAPDFALAAPAPAWLVFLATFGRHEREALAAIGITGPEGFEDLPPAEWPDWAAQLLAEAEHATGPASGGERPASGDGGAREHYARSAIGRELAALAATAPGAQDVAMNNAALRVWGLLKGAGLEGEAATARERFFNACRRLSHQPGRERWTERDFSTKWDRARDTAHPRDLSHVEEGVFSDSGADSGRDGGPNGANGTNGTGPKGAPEPKESCTWSMPDLSLLGSGRRPAPPFPVDLLGPFWAGWVERRAAVASAPVDYVAVSLLACAGAMLANVRWPVAGAGWSEPPVIWAALVGHPGMAKSPGMDQAFSPLSLAEERLAIGFDDALRRHETDKQAAKAKREEWEVEVKVAVKAGENPPAMPEEAEVPEPPVRPRVRVADATVEALAALAAGLPRGLLLVRDELAGWFGGFDRYGAGGSDRAFAIEMYGGRSYVVDRVKHAEPRRIRHLSIGVLGGAQPDKLPVIIDGPDDGLSSRLLWAWPEALPEFNLARDIADDHSAAVAFARLADLAMGTDDLGRLEPRRVRLTREAEDALEEFARDMGRRGEEATGGFASALDKARGHALRLSGVLTFLWWCGTPETREPDGISEEAVNAAAALLDAYFVPMAERVFGDAAIPLVERGAMAVARHLRKARTPEFNTRTARREIGGLVREATAMDGACKVLVEAGLIRPRFSRTGPSKGRQARNYEVNPALFRRAS